MWPFVGGWVRVSVKDLPCRHDTDYSFCAITFKLHIVGDERMNQIDFGSRG